MKRHRVGSVIALHGSVAVVTGWNRRHHDYKVYVFHPSFFGDRQTWWSRSAPIKKVVASFVGFVTIER